MEWHRIVCLPAQLRPKHCCADVFSVARSWWLCKESDVLSWAKRYGLGVSNLGEDFRNQWQSQSFMQGNLHSSNLLEDGVGLVSPARASCPPMPADTVSFVDLKASDSTAGRGWDASSAQKHESCSCSSDVVGSRRRWVVRSPEAGTFTCHVRGSSCSRIVGEGAATRRMRR
jgi:hypothetical protein